MERSTSALNVLIAEADAVSRLVLGATLEHWGYTVRATSTGAQAWEVLRETRAPEVALLDASLPDVGGVELCRRLRASRPEHYVYVLLLDGRNRREDIVAGLDAGADDYLTKPFDPAELQMRLGVARRIHQLEENLWTAREELNRQTTHDSLTGVWNRSTILRRLATEVARSERELTPLSVVMVDLDHFKNVNDTYGHLAGDAVLQGVTGRMAEVLRPYDALGRYGGEEFLLVLPGCDEQQGQALAERLRAHLQQEIIQVGRTCLTVTLSLGVAAWDPQRPQDIEDLMRAADEALYVAKRQGRNRVSTASQAPESAIPAA